MQHPPEQHGVIIASVNGVPLHESSYLYPGSAPSLGTFHVTVPPGRLFVMGDAAYERDGNDLQSRGLYLDEPPWRASVFSLTKV